MKSSKLDHASKTIKRHSGLSGKILNCFTPYFMGDFSIKSCSLEACSSLLLEKLPTEPLLFPGMLKAAKLIWLWPRAYSPWLYKLGFFRHLLLHCEHLIAMLEGAKIQQTLMGSRHCTEVRPSCEASMEDISARQPHSILIWGKWQP